MVHGFASLRTEAFRLRLNPTHPNQATRFPWRRVGWIGLRCAIAVAVAVGVGRRIWLERERLTSYDSEPSLPWLLLAAAAYIAGLSTCAGFWQMTLRDRGYEPIWTATWAAYFAGHLGKYIPGKGMVLVIRAGMMRNRGVDLGTGAVTCLQETVVMMATGAGVALVLFLAIDTPYRLTFIGLAAILFVLLGTLGVPPVVTLLSRLANRSQVGEPRRGPRNGWSTLLCGTALISVGWVLMGLSLVAVLISFQHWSALLQRHGTVGAIGLLTAAVALATVGGFVSMLPGGLGSREWILVETLGPALGSDGPANAAVMAIALRLVWIAGEIAGTAVFWIIDRLCKKPRFQSS